MRKKSEAYDDPLRQQSLRSQLVIPHSRSQGQIGTTQPLAVKTTEKVVIAVDEDSIEWSNLIFLPFHPVFNMFVLCAVFVKSTLGPIQSVYPIVYCNDLMDQHPISTFIKYFYCYFCDSIYGIDTFLHVVHRQVTDKAMRREHLPKSARLLLCDILALIPFHNLVQGNICPVARLWPNVLAFNEFLIIYRVAQYFTLMTTHSYMKLVIGYIIILAMCLNCITCFWLLLTAEGFCEYCNDPGTFYDWRASVSNKLGETDLRYTTYVYAFTFIFSFTQNSFFDDETQPTTIMEFYMTCCLMLAGYLLSYFVIIPKSFAETMLRLRKVCVKFPIVKKIVDETKRRNPDSNAHNQVEDYYKLIWRKQGGVIRIPELFVNEIPRYLRLDMKQDLLWPLFYHSPTLRKTSYPFRRWISETVVLTYKFAGDLLFQGALAGTNLYFIKSGIVNIISADDGVTPILSCTSGTVFGDINFYVPHRNRKVLVRCLTYSEIYYVQRKCLLQALHKYPDDRMDVMTAAQERLQHAKILYCNKNYMRGFDRNEDEGVAWLKRRWWHIHDLIHKYAQITGKSKEQIKFDLPHEETIYHCSKYIGQLVLCTPEELQTKSMFTKSSFPWILNPHSKFGLIWDRIVTVHLYLVLLLYPPNLIKSKQEEWFIFFSHWTNTVYAADIAVSLLTAVKTYDSVTSTFATVAFERFKSLSFMLDILSTIWIEDLAYLAGAEKMYYTLQFNRLIKIYKLFIGSYLKFDIRKSPLVHIGKKIALTQIATTIISSHVVFEIANYAEGLSVFYFFGDKICSRSRNTDCKRPDSFFGVSILWVVEWTYTEFFPKSLADNYIGLTAAFVSYLVVLYSRSSFVSYLYLKNQEVLNFQRFVVYLKHYYEHYRLHQDLLKRLDRYLICHWKYYQGLDVMFSNDLSEEPHEVYWKAQGEVAERIIKNSGPFEHADPGLIRELACQVKFLLLPRQASVIMFGTVCRNVVWVVQGYVKSEYYDDKGELQIVYLGCGSLLAAHSVFLGKPSVRTYTSYTECEIAYISMYEFWPIFKRYSLELTYVKTCAKEFSPQFDVLFKKHVLKHKDHQTKLRDRIYSTRMSMVSTSKVLADIQDNRSLPFEGLLWGEPESRFMQTWLLFRAIIVYLSIISAVSLGGVGSVSRWIFMMISAFCECIGYIDIIMKLFLAYYDDRGILITSKRKCLMNYLTKAFILDVIGVYPWYLVISGLLSFDLNDDDCFLINTVCKFSHLYIVFAYFDYISDVPTVNIVFLMILKWQLVNILIVLGVSHYFMVKCVDFVFDSEFTLTTIHFLNEGCWMPDYRTLPSNLGWDELHLIFAQSLYLGECGLLGVNSGRFTIDRKNLGVGAALFALCLIFWFISGYTLTLLILGSRGNNLYKHSVHQLKRFLKSERVEKPIIERVIGHFRYCWIRTQGIDIQRLTNERIGLMFRQDLNYYFYKKTFSILDTIIKCGETTSKQLASASTQTFLLAGQDIFREMDLVPTVYIVHRGRVIITKEGKKIVVLTKGDIFGQLTGKIVRPIFVTATTDDRVDLLNINIVDFQNIITDRVRENIYCIPQHKKDFIATRNMFIENPYDTVQYILRGRKAIKLPRAKHTTQSRHGTWYAYSLYLMWFIGPFLTTTFVIMFLILPPGHELWTYIYVILIILDVVHLMNFIAEFYSVELAVENNKCVPQRLGTKRLKEWFLYVDVLTLLIPLLTLISNNWVFQLVRLLRLKFFFNFYNNFCKSFRSKLTPIILKLSMLLLMIHFFTCGWIFIACRDEKFPLSIRDIRNSNDTVDFSQWMHPDDRGGGCARTTRVSQHEKTWAMPSFIVPRYWQDDYAVALTSVLFIFTHTNIDNVMAMTVTQTYYRVVITYIMYLVDIWVLAVAINTAYTKFRDLYKFDYEINKIITHLTTCGLCDSLAKTFHSYSRLLWKRHKGDKLPEIAYDAPLCLRQDLFSALYMHHLEAAPTFRQLPDYFKRQLVSRFQRIVIFPGKCIVREGDTFNVTYFIHEGEVEKWYNDASGDGKLLSVLYTNGYFGCISGLFVNSAFQYSYYSRTVVDLMVLNLHKWQDLLDGYPDVKAMIYESTINMKKEHQRARGTQF